MFVFRRADADEIPAVQAIAHATWPITYEPILGQVQVDYMLKTLYSNEVLQKQFAEGCLFYFIYDNEDLAGFAAFGKQDETAWKLYKLYILPPQQGTGAGKTLLQFVIRKVISLGCSHLLLNVNRFNKARFFYEKNRFYVIEEIDIDIGNGFFMNDYIMQLDLDAE